MKRFEMIDHDGAPHKHNASILLHWLPAFLLMALIFRLSSDPSLGGPGWVTHLARRIWSDPARLARWAPLLTLGDNYASWLAHFSFFGALAATFWWACRVQWPRGRPVVLASGLTTLYALSDEFHQHFVPGRQADWRDIATDMAGAAVVLLLITRWCARHQRWAQRT